jgi:hypothetical protein
MSRRILFNDTRFADQQLRQLGEVDSQPVRPVLGQHIGRRAAAGLNLIVEIAELLPVPILR